MAKYLVQFQPDKLDMVKAELVALHISPVSVAFDYITVDIPPEMVDKVRAQPGVIAVVEERKHEVKQIMLPIDRKLAQFGKLFWSNPLTGPLQAFKFSLEADMGKERIPTSESRKMVGADVADADGIAGKGVRVACLDTGTDYLSFQGPYSGGKSSVEGQPVAIDENGHGTHVETTISGRPFQSIHGLLQGVAVDAEVAAFKVLGYGIGAGTTSAILRGLMDAFEWKADIINMSLGSEYTTERPEEIPECRAIQMLTQQGVIVVVAVGNSGPDPNTVGVPANSPYALTVGAVDMEGKVASFSSRGPTAQGLIKPDCVAPGVNILSSTTGLIALMQFMDGPRLAAISGSCLCGDSLVLLEGGYVRRLSDMKCGDILITPFGQDIVQAFLPQGEAQVYKVELDDGRFIEATREHKFLVRSKKGTTWARPSEYEWTELKDLAVGDEVILYRMTRREATNLLWQDSVVCEEYGDYINPYIPQWTARGKANPFFGKHHTEESRKLMSDALRGRIAWNKGLTTDDVRLKTALGKSQEHGFGTYKRTAEIVAKLSASLKGRGVWNKGIPHSSETKAKLSQAQRQNLQDPEYYNQVSAWLKTGREKHLRQKPLTRGESFAIGFLDHVFPNEYKFNNGWFCLLGKYPDIVNVNGKKKLVEILGERWHKPQDEEKLTALYSTVGYDCLVIWSREIEKEPSRVMAKLRDFASNDMKERTKVRRIKAITSVGIKTVYDITTESHSFVANGFVVHNSMSTPHDAGVTALGVYYARSKGKLLTTDGIKEALSLYGHAKNNDDGWGLLTYPMLKRYIDEKLGKSYFTP